jgi:hypothetical protein
MDHALTFAIVLSRQPAVEKAPGLISFQVDGSGGTRVPTKGLGGPQGPPPRFPGYASHSGTLTDAALRGRLAYFDAHSANEIAAVRKALSIESGQATVYESWPKLEGCLRFWYGFIGSVIRPIESTCESCGKESRESIGGSVGESFLRRCGCGHVSRITVPNHRPVPVAVPSR